MELWVGVCQHRALGEPSPVFRGKQHDQLPGSSIYHSVVAFVLWLPVNSACILCPPRFMISSSDSLLLFFLSWERIHNAHLEIAFCSSCVEPLPLFQPPCPLYLYPSMGSTVTTMRQRWSHVPQLSPLSFMNNVNLFNATTSVQNVSVCWSGSWEDLLRGHLCGCP